MVEGTAQSGLKAERTYRGCKPLPQLIENGDVYHARNHYNLWKRTSASSIRFELMAEGSRVASCRDIRAFLNQQAGLYNVLARKKRTALQFEIIVVTDGDRRIFSLKKPSQN